MYNLKNVVKDFPWTCVTYNGIEPWRKEGSNWFEGLPKGWGNVCFKWLTILDHLLEEYNGKDYIVIEQVKEKWGGLRFYYTFLWYPRDTSDKDIRNGNYIEVNDELVRRFDEVVSEFEADTMKVCYDCGTRLNVDCYSGWVHYACPECEKRRMEEDEKRIEELRANFKKKG